MRLHKSTSIFVDTPFTIFSYNLGILSPAVNCRGSYDTCISCQLQRTMVRSWKSIWFCNLGPFLGTQTKTIKAFFIHCEEDPLCVFGNILHDDVIKWKHFPRYWPFVRGIHRSPVNSPHKARDAERWYFLWSPPWINGWVDNREAGDLRRHRTQYDVIVMGLCNYERSGGICGVCIYFACNTYMRQ